MTAMTSRRGHAALHAVLAIALAALAAPAAAETYYDGSQARTVTLQRDLVADVVAADAKRSVPALVAGAVALPGVGDSQVRIYRVPAAAARAPAAPAAGLPVYREGDSPAGRLMALPGGVLVKFKADWNRERIDAFLAERGLAVERRLVMGGNWYRVGTPAGRASLDAANAIHATGQVLAASPNWWMQTATR